MKKNLFATLTTLAAVGLLSTASASAAVIFTDTFTRADNATVGNGWAEIGESAADVAVVGNALQLRNNNANADPSAAATQTLSTLGYDNITLSFAWAPLDPSDTGDLLFAEWRTGNAAWTTVAGGTILATLDLGGSTIFTSAGPLSLGAAADNLLNLQIRFRTAVSNGTPGDTEGALVDNVVVSGTAITAQAVPEPLTLSLFGAGLIGTGFAAMRRRRKAQKA